MGRTATAARVRYAGARGISGPFSQTLSVAVGMAAGDGTCRGGAGRRVCDFAGAARTALPASERAALLYYQCRRTSMTRVAILVFLLSGNLHAQLMSAMNYI